MTEPQATAAFELQTPQPVANLKDFSLVQVATNAREALFHWLEHQPTFGQHIGSSRIDQGFAVRLTDILKPHQHLLGRNASRVAWEMSSSTGFIEAKHDFSGADANAQTIPVLHLENHDSIHDDFIQNGKLVNPGSKRSPNASLSRQNNSMNHWKVYNPAPSSRQLANNLRRIIFCSLVALGAHATSSANWRNFATMTPSSNQPSWWYLGSPSLLSAWV
ncbi:hypothetical protein LCI18_013365 [Fusarium solani-melongenae]|uniref:Uncharacterized protein n=1 Tax=Fusarium solani subsp. cucurbitae TaxID=2747967 RepID=A0ACD3ZMW8_FUSSC|nr:hypothetical protein LCI18_013365 [Fusarium solani-melongenae]